MIYIIMVIILLLAPVSASPAASACSGVGIGCSEFLLPDAVVVIGGAHRSPGACSGSLGSGAVGVVFSAPPVSVSGSLACVRCVGLVPGRGAWCILALCWLDIFERIVMTISYVPQADSSLDLFLVTVEVRDVTPSGVFVADFDGEFSVGKVDFTSTLVRALGAVGCKALLRLELGDFVEALLDVKSGLPKAVVHGVEYVMMPPAPGQSWAYAVAAETAEKLGRFVSDFAQPDGAKRLARRAQKGKTTMGKGTIAIDSSLTSDGMAVSGDLLHAPAVKVAGDQTKGLVWSPDYASGIGYDVPAPGTWAVDPGFMKGYGRTLELSKLTAHSSHRFGRIRPMSAQLQVHLGEVRVGRLRLPASAEEIPAWLSKPMDLETSSTQDWQRLGSAAAPYSAGFSGLDAAARDAAVEIAAAQGRRAIRKPGPDMVFGKLVASGPKLDLKDGECLLPEEAKYIGIREGSEVILARFPVGSAQSSVVRLRVVGFRDGPGIVATMAVITALHGDLDGDDGAVTRCRRRWRGIVPDADQLLRNHAALEARQVELGLGAKKGAGPAGLWAGVVDGAAQGRTIGKVEVLSRRLALLANDRLRFDVDAIARAAVAMAKWGSKEAVESAANKLLAELPEGDWAKVAVQIMTVKTVKALKAIGPVVFFGRDLSPGIRNLYNAHNRVLATVAMIEAADLTAWKAPQGANAAAASAAAGDCLAELKKLWVGPSDRLVEGWGTHPVTLRWRTNQYWNARRTLVAERAAKYEPEVLAGAMVRHVTQGNARNPWALIWAAKGMDAVARLFGDAEAVEGWTAPKDDEGESDY